MKQKDFMLIGAVMVVSAIFSLVLSRFLFNSPAAHNATVEVVPAITADFPTPDKQYFNQYSIDPTQLIQIGTTNNTNPFNGTQQ